MHLVKNVDVPKPTRLSANPAPPWGSIAEFGRSWGGLGGGKSVELSSKNNFFNKKVYVFDKVWMCRKSHACQQIQPLPGGV